MRGAVLARGFESTSVWRRSVRLISYHEYARVQVFGNVCCARRLASHVCLNGVHASFCSQHTVLSISCTRVAMSRGCACIWEILEPGYAMQGYGDMRCWAHTSSACGAYVVACCRRRDTARAKLERFLQTGNLLPRRPFTFRVASSNPHVLSR
eukprot:3571995-Pyramimonas_sp.AAC.1